MPACLPIAKGCRCWSILMCFATKSFAGLCCVLCVSVCVMSSSILFMCNPQGWSLGKFCCFPLENTACQMLIVPFLQCFNQSCAIYINKRSGLQGTTLKSGRKTFALQWSVLCLLRPRMLIGNIWSAATGFVFAVFCFLLWKCQWGPD